MKDLPKRLEEYRLKNKLSKKAMADILGAPHRQVYYDIQRRNSVPKTYIPAAEKLLAENDPRDRLETEIASKLARLPEAKAWLVLQMIESLLDGSKDA